mmetsp:Transcript_6085/g.7928  ORF Transcript_6085/g.7928 Transcript_6085/m.7928 type:complete len:90 (-) Transcript_6085:493-762(-)
MPTRKISMARSRRCNTTDSPHIEHRDGKKREVVGLKDPAAASVSCSRCCHALILFCNSKHSLSDSLISWYKRSHSSKTDFGDESDFSAV